MTTTKMFVTVRGINPDWGVVSVNCNNYQAPAKNKIAQEKTKTVIQKQLTQKQEIQMPQPVSSRLPAILEGETNVTTKKTTTVAAKEKIIRPSTPGLSPLTRTVSGFFDKEEIRRLMECSLNDVSFNSEERENIPPEDQIVPLLKKLSRPTSQPLAESAEHSFLKEKRKLETIFEDAPAKFSTYDFSSLNESFHLPLTNSEPLSPIWFKDFWEEPENIV